MKELVIISILYCFDWVMDFITIGQWGRVRGEERVIFKMKEQH